MDVRESHVQLAEQARRLTPFVLTVAPMGVILRPRYRRPPRASGKYEAQSLHQKGGQAMARSTVQATPEGASRVSTQMKAAVIREFGDFGVRSCRRIP